jgi:undecaprenyl-diphosphatase
MAMNRKLFSAIFVILSGSLFILLVAVLNGSTEQFDQALRSWALAQNTLTSVTIWVDVSFLGSIAVISGATALSLLVFAFVRNWRAFRGLAIAMIGATVLDTSLKWLVHRPRPDEVYAHTLPSSFSFPSGHALFSFTFCFALATLIARQQKRLERKVIWIVAMITTALIGASRIFLGVHYGSDVLGGYLIGATWLIFLVALDSLSAA